MFGAKIYQNLFISALMLCCLVSAAESGEPSFSVDSYIPERFVDFRWNIGGRLQFNGNSESAELDYLSSPFDWRQYSGTYDRQVIQFDNNIGYRYETIPRFFELGGRLVAYFNHVNDQQSSSDPFDQSRYNTVDSDRDSKDYSLYLYETLDAGQYIAGDLFLSARGKLSFRYTDSPNNESLTESVSYIYYSPDTLRKHTAESQQDYSYDRKTLAIDINIMPGWGRMYEGQYAATALYMIDELNREGVLKRTPTAEEMEQLTEIIYQNRLKYAIDKRLRKIESLKEVLDFLQNNEIIDNTGPYGYLLIQDVWDYFPSYDRPFGVRLRGGTGIEFSSSRNQRSEDENEYDTYSYFHIDNPGEVNTVGPSSRNNLRFVFTEYESRGTYLAVKAEYNRPVNIRWQLDFTGEARYYFSAYSAEIEHEVLYSMGHNTFDKRLDTYTDYQAYNRIVLDGLARYIYNSRTNAGLEISYAHQHYNSAVQEHLVDSRTARDIMYPVVRYDFSETSLIFGGFLVYRISIPMTLRGDVQYSIYNRDVRERGLREDDRDNYNFYLTLTHHLY
jgi:hypothetical protein